MSDADRHWEPLFVAGAADRERVTAHVRQAVEQWWAQWMDTGFGQRAARAQVQALGREAAVALLAQHSVVYAAGHGTGAEVTMAVSEHLAAAVLGFDPVYGEHPLYGEPDADSIARSAVDCLIAGLVNALDMNVDAPTQVSRSDLPAAEVLALAEHRSDWVFGVTLKGSSMLGLLFCHPRVMRRWVGRGEPANHAPVSLSRRSEVVQSCEVRLRAELGSVELNAKELAQLERGDVLLLEPGDDERVVLMNEAGISVALASLGRRGERRALCVSSVAKGRAASARSVSSSESHR